MIELKYWVRDAEKIRFVIPYLVIGENVYRLSSFYKRSLGKFRKLPRLYKEAVIINVLPISEYENVSVEGKGTLMIEKNELLKKIKNTPLTNTKEFLDAVESLSPEPCER